MKKLIFIGSYIGEGVSGSHRQERFIRKALEEDYIVQLLKPDGSFKGIYEFTSIQSFENWIYTHVPLKVKGSINSSKLKNIFTPIKYLLFFDIIGYGFLNTIKQLKMVFKQKIDFEYFLLVSSPSISSAVATYIYTIFSSKNIVYSVDMRDAWAYHSRIKILKSVRKLIERKVLQRAKKVITVSKYLKEEFDRNYHINSELLYNVNIKLSKSNEQKIVNFDKSEHFSLNHLNICYFGSLPSGFYNIEEFCKGLMYYFTKYHIDKEIRFYFYGPCTELERLISSYPLLKDKFIFRASLTHEKAIYLMNRCNAVLFFGYNGDKNSGVVSTKIFEYFFLKCKIIAFDVRRDSDLDWLFNKFCKESVLINDAFEFGKYLTKTLGNLELLPYCSDPCLLSELDSDYNLFFKKITLSK